MRDLQRRLYDAGFAGLLYPEDYGGRGLTRQHQRAFNEEIRPYMSPQEDRLLAVSLGAIGPTLLDYGTEQQKLRHIPAMLRGDQLWVQLLSEPTSASDMAAARLRADRDGDTFVVNGAKMWSTGAHLADHAMVLARTNWDVSKHRGLTMLATRLDDPNITILPIVLANRESDLCQEFFDGVLVPSTNIVGREGEGWAVATRLLYHERNMTAGNGMDGYMPTEEAPVHSQDLALTVAQRLERTHDPIVRQLIAESYILTRLNEFAIERINSALALGKIPDAGAALLKLLWGVTTFRQSEITIQIGGPAALMSHSADLVNYGNDWLVARIATIAGGTNEMQRNQISERVLGMPRANRPARRTIP